MANEVGDSRGMRSYGAEPAAVDRDADSAWEVVPQLGGKTLDGVRVAGFRDRIAAGLDMQVLPQPAVVVIIGLGDEAVSSWASSRGCRARWSPRRRRPCCSCTWSHR